MKLYSNKARLTAKQVVEIRALRGKMFQYDIAKRYGVSPSTISKVMNRNYIPSDASSADFIILVSS